MKCHRCGNIMVWQRFYGLHEHFLGWKCILCGEIIDQLILENRRLIRPKGRKKQEVENLNT